MLSFLRLVIRVYEFTAETLPNCLMVYTDANSLLQTLARYLSYPYYFPNTTMDAEWDVLQAIHSSLKEFPSVPDLQHVKGHQV